MCYFIIESPKFYIVNRESEKGFMILKELLNEEVNQETKELIISQTEVLVSKHKQGTWGSYSDLFSSTNYLMTIMLFVIFYTSSFIFYGLIYVLPVVLQEFHKGVTKDKQKIEKVQSNMVTSEQYDKIISDIIISCIFEITSDVLNSLLPNISLIGRKGTIYLGFLCTGIFCMLCLVTPNYMPLYACFIRFFSNIPLQVANVYCSEVFPTYMRSTAIGICSALSRIGAFTAPFICDYLILKYPMSTFVAFLITSTTGFVIGVLLPYDTLNRTSY